MHIIPEPKIMELTGGSCSPEALAAISAEQDCDERIQKAAAALKTELEALTGSNVPLSADGGQTGLHLSHGISGEEYTLDIGQNRITINGTGPAGACYGIRTLQQLLWEYGTALPCCHIQDGPDFPVRGFYHDVSRGRVPKLAQLFRIADILSQYKINSLQLYIEDAFDFPEYRGIMDEESILTAEEIRALDDYCHERFIELVPSLSTFGHLYNLLQSDRYRQLCELENYVPQKHYWIEKMEHHTIDVSNPDSFALVTALIDRFIPLFRSRQFNICCDETFDLCKGRNAGKDPGEEYHRFLTQIIRHVQSRGKTVMMWGDIALHHPEKLGDIPAGTLMLNWDYNENPDEAGVRAFAQAGLTQLVCPGTASWNHFVEDIACSEGNIARMAQYGKKYGAKGLLNTNWGDFGNICAFNCSLYGLVMGAQAGWNAKKVPAVQFEKAASALLYDSKEINIIPILREIGKCERTCDWTQLVCWYSANTIEGKQLPLETDTQQTIDNITCLEGIIQTLSGLKAQNEQIGNLILACRGIQLMNRSCLRIKGVPGYTDSSVLVSDTEQWLVQYRAAWLRENKESQLKKIEAFIRQLQTTAIKG